MINANELRIGNYFFYKGEIINIGHIQKNFHSVLINGVGVYGWGKFEPIPLTPEILEKCGFEKDRSGFALPDKMSLSFSIDKDGQYNACWEDRSLHLPYRIKYLHQLQNLYFAITGEELNYTP